jgi:hypothetical protein
MGIWSRLVGRKSDKDRVLDVLRQFDDRFNYYECPRGCTKDIVLQTGKRDPAPQCPSCGGNTVPRRI